MAQSKKNKGQAEKHVMNEIASLTALLQKKKNGVVEARAKKTDVKALPPRPHIAKPSAEGPQSVTTAAHSRAAKEARLQQISAAIREAEQRVKLAVAEARQKKNASAQASQSMNGAPVKSVPPASSTKIAAKTVPVHPVKPPVKPAARPTPLCFHFQRFGKCKRRRTCPFAHLQDHVASCWDYLLKKCMNINCSLAHTVDLKRVPVCTRFLEAICGVDNCRFLHVNNGLKAALCEKFSVLGYCQNGDNCLKRHVWLCPDELIHGFCKSVLTCRFLHSGSRKKYISSDGSVLTPDTASTLTSSKVSSASAKGWGESR